MRVSYLAATSFNRSQVQHLTPLLDALPGTFSSVLPNILSLTEGDPLRMVLDNAVKGIPLLTAARESIEDFTTFSSYLPKCSGTPKTSHIAWELRLKVVYKQYPHSSTVQPNEAPFIKDKTVCTPKAANTSEGGVTDLRSEYWRCLIEPTLILDWGATVPVPLKSLASHCLGIEVLADILPKETLLWKLKMLKSASAYADSRLYAIKAQTLILCSGNDQLLPSQQEGERLLQLLPKCELRKFDDSGHFLLLEGSIDLVTVIKGTFYYRRGKYHDYASDFIPPTPNEAKNVFESYRLLNIITSSVMLSTLDDGKIVKGPAGIPSEGPVLLVGNHMLLGLDVLPLFSHFFRKWDFLVRGMAHPLMFRRQKSGRLPEISSFDSLRLIGAVPVAASNLFKLLSSKSHVLLFPGGAREVFHRKGEEYKLFWPEQSEFIRMAAKFGAKIIPFGAVGEDDLGQVVIDYDDLVKIPYFRSEIESLTNEAVQLRTSVDGELANQQLYLPGILPKIPGRFYFYFGKPIETEGRKQELMDKKKSPELYFEVKSEVERCIAYLKEKRESDPYRNILSRLLYQATNGPTSDIPTFEI
ncbi:acyltransferase-like protein chloroplastic-like [Trifolium pratense]|uniref:Acyltransferase-like protein chloroplastic-like n=1 Tax=Trifolium pratense TaxID=57577 RepID=A0A2K3PBX2_TRIPR|nr:acyltransferase-like protein chloroplastic-like [Trifolium pratense]